MLNLTEELTDQESNLEIECGEKILKNLDKYLNEVNSTHENINRLLSIRHYISTQVLQQSN